MSKSSIRIHLLGARRALALAFSIWLTGGSALPPLLAGSKGRGAFKDGRKAELNKDYDKALEFYERARGDEPDNQNYIMAVRRIRFVAGQAHVDQGHRLLDQGKIEEAAAEFEKAVSIDPASAIAEQELRRTQELIKKERQKPASAKPSAPGAADETKVEPGLSPILAGKKQTEALLETAQPIPQLKPLSSQPINIKASNNSKVVFETIGKLAGVNVLFDPEVQGKRVTVELNNATLYQALDYVATISKAYWKPLSSNAIFITDDNPTKRRDYEDYVVKTFYLSNAYTAQELQEIATAIRTLTEIRRVMTINSLNALVVRSTADQMALVEKVLNDIDKSRAELIVDVMVLEVSQSRTRELGIAPLSGSTPGINVPVSTIPVNPAPSTTTTTPTTTTPTTGTTIPTTTTTTTTNTTPSGGGTFIGKTNIVDFALNIPSISVKALMSRSDTRVLQSPRVRGFDGYKASVRIGDRIPIATGSFQPGIGGVGINPLVNTQFNYQDVGVVLDLTPKIHFGKEVSMHVMIEISNVRDRIDIGGISQPIIGQRKIEHDIRLKEGESSIIGGLMQTQTTRSIAGIPVLSQIPILRYIFSNERLEKSENEILIVLTPHVIRVPEITDVNMKGISAGTDQQVKVNFAPPQNDHPALPPVPPPPPAAAPAPATPPPAATTAPVAAPPAAAPAPPSAAPATPLPPAATPGAAPATAVPPAAMPAPSVAQPVAPSAAPHATPSPGVPAHHDTRPPAEAHRPPPPPAAAAAPATSEVPAALTANRAENVVPRLKFDRTNLTAAVEERVTLNVLAENVRELFAVPFRVSYDPKVLHLVDVRKGGLLSIDGQDVIFSKNVQDDAGEASINLSRFPGAGGISGSGALLTLEFHVGATGRAIVRLTNVAARNAKLESIPLEGAQAEVTVK